MLTCTFYPVYRDTTRIPFSWHCHCQSVNQRYELRRLVANKLILSMKNVNFLKQILTITQVSLMEKSALLSSVRLLSLKMCLFESALWKTFSNISYNTHFPFLREHTGEMCWIKLRLLVHPIKEDWKSKLKAFWRNCLTKWRKYESCQRSVLTCMSYFFQWLMSCDTVKRQWMNNICQQWGYCPVVLENLKLKTFA